MSGADSGTKDAAPLGERFARYRERRRRGAKELGRLQRSDAVLFSPGNSGRTWLRVMLTRVIEQCFALSSPPLVGFDNLKKMDGRIPAIVFTHNRWLPYFRKPRPGRECLQYYPHRVMMLIRNPLDTCVSQYFQWQHRSKDHNVWLKGWPPRSSGLSLQAFLDHPETGVAKLCAELDTWLRESAKFEEACVLRYEDMLEDPGASLARAATFLRLPATDEILREAVDYGSFSNMKRREAGGGSPESVNAAQSSSPMQDGHKARVGKACGYLDYLTPQDCERYAAVVSNSLPPALGYANLPEIRPLAA